MFLGIDPSLTRSAFAIVDYDGNLREAISAENKLTGEARLRHVAEKLGTFMRKHIKDPQLIGGAIEGPSLKSTHREFDLGEMTGVLKFVTYGWIAGSRTLTVVEPKRLKLFISGDGAATKEDVLYSVKKGYGVDFEGDDDKADAFALAQVARCLAFPHHAKTRAQLEVVHAILHPPVKKSKAVRAPKNNF